MRHEYTREQFTGVLSGLEGYSGEHVLRLSPNPASELTQLEFRGEEHNGDHLVEIYGNTGSLMARFTLPGATRSHAIRLDSYPAGFYYLTLHSARGVAWRSFQIWK